MDTSQIKKFAIAARKVLLKGVINKISTLGFDAQGNVTLAQMPVLAHNDTNFNGRIIPGTSFFHQWNALHKAIQQKGVKNVYEEVAYTWFNRLIAIRILQNQENQLIANVLDFVDDSNTPSIVNDARHGILPSGMSADTETELNRLLSDDSKTTEQFAILISAFCESTPILRKIFGRIDDYTELLLPSDILAKNGFVDMLNNTDYITPEDYKQTELIGWLYQFYISERKDEVFDLGEWSAEDIPAGTQIFTPNWIVKYMVENTLGRIYLDNNPDSDLGNDMKYLVEQSEGEHPIFEFENMENLRCADFSCGSGHILGEFFDMLYRIYTDEKWYDSHDAIESIFKNNIAGIDLDTRAMQLSTFALLLKACQKDESFINADVMPSVLDMPSVTFDGAMPTVNELFRNYNEAINKEATDAFRLIEKADELGSIMKFNLSDATREAMQTVVADYRIQADADAEIVKSMDLMLMLTDKYSAICMNPPYMGRKHMDDCLALYTNNEYPNSKADLFAVFMDVAIERLQKIGKFGMINMQSWMFLPKFEDLRYDVISNYTIDNVLHLGTNTFEELTGEVVNSTTFVITKNPHVNDTNAKFFRFTGCKTCNDKEQAFLRRSNRFITSQSIFLNINGYPIGYWLSNKILSLFDNKDYMSKYGKAYQGLATADNDRFTRLWYEVSLKSIGFNMDSTEEALYSEKKWFPYNNGGKGRRWYGNQTDIVNWENDGYEIKEFKDEKGKQKSRPQNTGQYFKEVISWNMITLSGLYFRYFPKGFIFSNASNSFPCNGNILGVLGFLNSKFTPNLLELLSPGTNMSNGVLAKFPNMVVEDITFQGIVKHCIDISKQDWDAHETSWDFKENELIRIFNSDAAITLEHALDFYTAEWTGKFNELHDNEEELNRKFIDIYGLQYELTPDVPLNEVTILQQKEIAIDGNNIKWNKDEIIKQLISYAMGCWMGRYRLDCPGLHIAHPNPTEEELAGYNAFGKPFEIDDDGIIPLMGEDSPFADNAVNRMKEFVAQVFGEENKAANIHFIEATLGRNMTLEKFFKKDFWKDHLRRYQKRPIYWLFQSSSRNPAFQVLVYMHRMDAYTCEKVRTYLLSYIEYLNNRIAYLESQTTTAAVTSELNTKREALKECTEYELRLHDVANQQIAFDLDDGVKANYAKFGDVLASVN